VAAIALAWAGVTPAVLAAEEAPVEPETPLVNVEELHYGAAVVFETVVSAGDICPERATAPCILGSGGGPAIWFGYRSRGPWYIAGAYEFSRQDSSNLLRLPILQQLRADARYYFDYNNRLTFYLAGSAGAAAYGSEWAIDTGGVVAGLGAGLEFEVSRTATVGAALLYRPLLLRRWTDSAGQLRADRYLGMGLAHLTSLQLIFELRNPLPRW
jgi:hypothetical protein